MSSNHEVLGGMHDYEWTASERYRPKREHEPRLLGRIARLLFEETSIDKIKAGFSNVVTWWKNARTEDKADRAYNGSLAEIQHTIVPYEEAYDVAPYQAPRPVSVHRQGEEGRLYRSVHARETAEGPGSIDDEMAEVMSEAVARAQQHLGALPVLTVMGEGRDLPVRAPGESAEQAFSSPSAVSPTETARSDDTPDADDDAALLQRLEAAYAHPAVEPQRPKGRHRAPRPARRFPFPTIRHQTTNNDLTSTSGK